MADDIDTVNKTLIQQIIKLRQAKTELQETFNDLDDLLLDTSNLNNSSFSKPSRRRKPRVIDELSFSSSSSSHDDDYAVRVAYDSVNELTSDLDDSSDDLTISSKDTTRRSKHRHKSKTPPRSPASIKFAYKMPINYLPPRPISTQFDSACKKPVGGSDWFDKWEKNRPSVHRPAWVPNGRFQPPYKPTLSSSMSSLSDYKKDGKKSVNSSFAAPWRHTGKIKPDSGIYLSSQDLTRSVDRGSFKKEKNKPKDIGPGWKVSLGGSKPNLRVYSSLSDDRDPIKKVTVKRKIIVDDKDIGGGWKTTLGKPKNDFSIYSHKPPVDETSIYAPKQLKRTTVVKRKVIVDERDVGKGWKPVKVQSKDDLRIYESRSPPPFKQEVKMKKKFVDEKDVGKGWKPVGRTKADDYPKSMSGEFKKSSGTESDAGAGKPPLPKEAAKPKWIPAGKTRTLSPPSTSEIPKGKKTPAGKTAPKSRSNIITSTPNMSKNFDEENPLDASIIEKKPEENKPKKSSKDNTKEEVDLNEKISEQVEDINTDDKPEEADAKRETVKDDEEAARSAPVEDEIKPEEAAAPQDDAPKEEEKPPNEENNKKEAPANDEEEEIHDDDIDETPKDFILTKFFGPGGFKKIADDDDDNEPKSEGGSAAQPSEKISDGDEEISEEPSSGNAGEKKSDNDSVFKVVDEDEDDGDQVRTTNDGKKIEANKPADPKDEKKEDSQLWNFKDSDDE